MTNYLILSDLKKTLFALAIGFCFANSANAQTKDSLLQALQKSDDALGKAIIYSELGDIEMNSDTAIMYYRKVWELNESLGNYFAVGQSINKMASKMYRVYEFDSAIYYWKSAMNYYNLSEKNWDKKELDAARSTVYYYISLGYYRKGDILESVKNVQESLKTRLQYDDQVAILNCYNILGIIHLSQDELSDAENYLSKAYDLAISQNDTSHMSNLSNNLATLFSKDERYDKALEYFKVSLFLTKEMGQTDLAIKANIGAVLKELGEYAESKKILEQVVDDFLKTDDVSGKIRSLNLLSDLYIELKEWKKIIELSEQSIDFLILVPDLEEQSAANENLSIAYENLGDMNNAYIYYKVYTQLNDSIFNEAKSKEIDRLEAEFEFEQNQRQIGELTEENLKNEIQIAEDRNIRFLLIGAITLVVLVFIILILFYKRKQERKRHGLEMKKLEIEQRMLRSQMNPHFIFNALNSIQRYISTNHTYEAEVFLSKFSLLMRNILENSMHQYISLDTEVETLNLYLSLEKLRFDNKFDYIINDGLMDAMVKIPPMLMQPFVENAILHGMKGKEIKGYIQVRFSETGDEMLLCEVEDDGVGRGAINNKTSDHVSLATQLTSDRVQYFNQDGRKGQKENFDMKIIDLKDANGQARGTLVQLLIPMI